MPTAVTGAIMHPLLFAFPSLFHLPTSLPVFPSPSKQTTCTWTPFAGSDSGRAQPRHLPKVTQRGSGAEGTGTQFSYSQTRFHALPCPAPLFLASPVSNKTPHLNLWLFLSKFSDCQLSTWLELSDMSVMPLPDICPSKSSLFYLAFCSQGESLSALFVITWLPFTGISPRTRHFAKPLLALAHAICSIILCNRCWFVIPWF